MTEYVRPMDLHSHNDGCELYGCIAVVKADEHKAALDRLSEALKARDFSEQCLHALQEKFGAQSRELVGAMDRLDRLTTEHHAQQVAWQELLDAQRGRADKAMEVIRFFVDPATDEYHGRAAGRRFLDSVVERQCPEK